MSRSLFGWANTVTEPDVVFTVLNQVSQMPPQNLAGQSGSSSTAWQVPLGAAGSYPVLRIAPVSRRTYAAIGVFRTNLTSAATLTFEIYTAPSTLVYQLVLPTTFISGFGQAVCFPANIAGDYVQITFADPANPDGFINVPLAFAGPAFIPMTAVSWQTTTGRDDDSDVVVTRGGQEYVTLKWQRRRWEMDMQGLRQSEVWTQVDVLRRTARTGVNIIAVPDIDNASTQYETTFGRLQDTADISYPYGNADRRAYRARVTERL